MEKINYIEEIKFDMSKNKFHDVMNLDLEKIELLARELTKTINDNNKGSFDQTKKAIELASNLEELIYLIHVVAYNQGIRRACSLAQDTNSYEDLVEKINKEGE